MDIDDRAERAARGLHRDVASGLDLAAAQDELRAAARHRRSRLVKMRVGLVAGTALAVLAVFAFVAGDDNGEPRNRFDETANVVDTDSIGNDDLAGAAEILAAMPSGAIDGKQSWKLPVQIRPQTDVADGQTVTVYGRGFEPNDSLGIVQCSSEADVDNSGVAGCELGTDNDTFGSVTYATADPNGNVVAQFVVKRYITTPQGEVDCFETAERCLVGLGAVSNYDRSGGAYVNFAEAPDFDTPTLSVTPDGPLAAGQEVTATIAGWVPKRDVRLQQCVGDVCQDLLDGKADAAGDYSATVIVGDSVAGPDGVVPCDGGCELRATGIGVEGASSMPFPDGVPLDLSAEPLAEGPSSMTLPAPPPTTNPPEPDYPEDHYPGVCTYEDCTTKTSVEFNGPPETFPGTTETYPATTAVGSPIED